MRNPILTPRTLSFFLLPAAAFGFVLVHAGTATHAQAAAPATGSELVTYKFGAYQWLSVPRTIQCYHGVQFGQDDATMKTDAAVALLDKDQNWISAQAQGPVHIYDSQDDLTGQHGSVDFTKHLATLHDNIILVVKPGKREANANGSSLRKQFKDPATLTCQAMTYDYKFKVGRIPVPLTVTQVVQTKDNGLQTRVLTAEAGLYNGKAQTIQLIGYCKVTLSDGSVAEGDTRLLGKPVVISIKEGAETLLVPFPTQGHFTVKPQTSTGKDTSADEEPDLSLPTLPARTSAPGDAVSAPSSPVQDAPAPSAPATGPVPGSGTSPSSGGAAGTP